MAQQLMVAPVQCEDSAEPNSYIVVYDTETYNYKRHGQNIFPIYVDTVVWGEESFHLSRTPSVIPAITHNTDLTEDADADTTEDVDMESRQWIMDWEVIDIEYTDGPEESEVLKGEEAVKKE